MKKHSTGALTQEQKDAQDARFKQNHKYDYVFIGSGFAALSSACLLANAGKKVCILEAHDRPGGYGHTFEMGGYHFCAQIHYIWGCQPGGNIYEFLKKIGLEKEITFEKYDENGYDRMAMPDGKFVFIPNGWDNLVTNVEKVYPGHKESVSKFVSIIKKINEEIARLPQRQIKWYEYITKGWKFLTLLKYKNSTLQDLFDECKLDYKIQAALCAQAGDMMMPPKELSLFAYVGLMSGYNKGAYYPTKHFKFMVERLVKFIEDKGGHIYYETTVDKINSQAKTITDVITTDGKKFEAPNFVCNMDPQKASHMIGREKFPKSDLTKLSYKYSESGVMIYLGLKNIDLKKLGFGKFNTWHMEQWDMNKTWDEQRELNFENPWIFMGTPTLHTKDTSTTPEGGAILEVATYCPYKPFQELQEKGYKDYFKLKLEIANKMLDIVEKKYIPNLKDHIVTKSIGSPTTNEDFCLAPMGNAYGSELSTINMSAKRLKADTPFSNFYWCNASSGFAGVHGTISTGVLLYSKITGDRVLKTVEYNGK